MEQQKINEFVATYGKNFAEADMPLIKEKLATVDDSKFEELTAIPYKNPTLIIVLSIFFGTLGVDRFMLGQVGLGIVKLITCGAGGIWTIIDWFMVMGKAREMNRTKFLNAIA